MASFAVNFCWGLIFLVSLTGWGRLVAGREAREAGWGLHAAWGMGLFLVIGGPLMLAGWATREVLIALILAGCAAWLALNGGRWKVHKTALAWFGAAVVLVYAPQVVQPFFNANDDFIAYLPFVRKIQETGSLMEPFSLRRLAGFGGQSLLQAGVACFGGAQNTGMLDAGIAPLILAAVAWSEVLRRGGTRGQALAVAALAVAFPQMRRNLGSQVTGAVLFFAMYRTLLLPLQPVRQVLLLALLAAGAATLRAHYLMGALVIAPLCWLLMTEFSRAPLVRWTIRASAFVSLSAALLAAWMLLLYRSSGSALYPVWRGYQRVEFAYADPLGVSAMARWMLGFFVEPATLAFLLPVLAVLPVRRSRPLLAMMAGAMATCLGLLVAFTRSDHYHLLRYSYALLLPLLAAAVIEGVAGPRRRVLPIVLAVSAGAAVWGMGPLALSTLTAPWQLVPALVARTPILPDPDAEAHRALDRAIPRGATVLAALPAPFLMSSRNHRVYLADLPAQAGPPPGVPVGQGAEALKRYLLGRGIEFIAYADFDREPLVPEYSRPLMRSRTGSRQVLMARMASDYLDFMGNLDALRASGPVVFQNNGYYLVHLR